MQRMAQVRSWRPRIAAACVAAVMVQMSQASEACLACNPARPVEQLRCHMATLRTTNMHTHTQKQRHTRMQHMQHPPRRGTC